MNIKEVGKALIEIESILFLTRTGSAHLEEIESAHKKSKEVIEKFLVPNDAF